MEVVKYHNDVNKISMGILKEKEIDLFFTLMFKCRDEGTRKQVLNFEELKRLTGQQRTDRLENYLWNLFKKMVDLKFTFQGIDDAKGKYKEIIVVFTHFKIYSESKELHISISEEFKSKLNGLLGNFTIFELKELVNLDSKYSKTIFRLLKQWESAKKYTVKIEEFRILLGIPGSYKMSDIDKQILNPSLEELRKFFPGLKLKKLKKGVKVESLSFTWIRKKAVATTPEKPLPVGIGEVPTNDDSGLSPEDEERALSLIEPELITSLKIMKKKMPSMYWITLKNKLKNK